MKNIMKIIQFFEESILLIKGVSKTFENKAKEQKDGLLTMLLGTLNSSLLGNLLTGKGIIQAGEVTTGAGVTSASRRPEHDFLVVLHPSTNFEVQIYYKKGLDLMVFIREIIHLNKNDEVYIINVDDYKSICLIE